MLKNIQTAQEKLELSVKDVYQKVEETSLQIYSLRKAEKQNLRIAKRIIARIEEGKG